MRHRFVALAAFLLAPAAAGDPARRVEGLAGAGLGFRHLTELDLAAEAEADGFGAGSDTSDGAMTFDLGGGVLLPFWVEIAASGRIGFGGLSLGGVEDRYFGTREEVGSAITAGADASARFAPPLLPDLRLLVGPAVGFTRLSASSSAGLARVDLLGVGFDLGARHRVQTISRVVDGHIQLVLSFRRELPQSLRVERSSDDTLFTGTGGGDDALYSYGVSVGYVFGFHRAERQR